MGHGIAHAAIAGGFRHATVRYLRGGGPEGSVGASRGSSARASSSASSGRGRRRHAGPADVDHLIIGDALQDADLVIEAAPEKIDVKLALLADVDAHAPATAIVATNTSALSITELAGSMAQPSRVAGMHFFNPVHRMKLVEIVRALETAPATLEAIEEVAAADGEGDRARARVARASSRPASTPASATKRSTC